MMDYIRDLQTLFTDTKDRSIMIIFQRASYSVTGTGCQYVYRLVNMGSRSTQLSKIVPPFDLRRLKIPEFSDVQVPTLVD